MASICAWPRAVCRRWVQRSSCRSPRLTSAGHTDEARHNYELAKRAGLAVGQKNLADAERQAYFATVKLLGEDALARDDLDAAIENYHLSAESERSGLETLRTLATLHERKGDALSAMRVTDQALPPTTPRIRTYSIAKIAITTR